MVTMFAIMLYPLIVNLTYFLQISHTLLSLINPETGRPFPSSRKRLLVFTKMLQSGIPQSLNWKRHVQPSRPLNNLPVDDANVATGTEQCIFL